MARHHLAACSGEGVPARASDAYVTQTFDAFADSFDEASGRYLGLRCGQPVTINPETLPGLLVRPDAAQRQKEADEAAARAATTVERPGPGNKDVKPDRKDGKGDTPPLPPKPEPKPQPKRFYGSVELDSTRVGRDAGQIATELIAHLTGLVGAKVRVTLEIEGPMARFDRVVGRTFGRLCDAALGDARCGLDLEAHPGTVCDKRFATCGQFGNTDNFRGFPDIPGDDFLLARPLAGGRHDGGSRR